MESSNKNTLDSHCFKEIDYYEKDAMLVIGDEEFYIQFNADEPTLLEAVQYLVKN